MDEIKHSTGQSKHRSVRYIRIRMCILINCMTASEAPTQAEWAKTGLTGSPASMVQALMRKIVDCVDLNRHNIVLMCNSEPII